MSEPKLTHTGEGGEARMVDVGAKPHQKRIALARGSIRLKPATIELVRENQLKKGDVISVARIAGIQAAKQTSALIPLCHNLLLESIRVDFEVTGSGIDVSAEVQSTGQTGVEMEALTAVSVALLTVYDMCKAVDRDMMIENIHLEKKTKQ